jgi:hypothetical protein
VLGIKSRDRPEELIVHVTSSWFVDASFAGSDVAHTAIRCRKQDRVVEIVEFGRLEEGWQPPRPEDTVEDRLEAAFDVLASRSA